MVLVKADGGVSCGVCSVCWPENIKLVLALSAFTSKRSHQCNWRAHFLGSAPHPSSAT